MFPAERFWGKGMFPKWARQSPTQPDHFCISFFRYIFSVQEEQCKKELKYFAFLERGWGLGKGKTSFLVKRSFPIPQEYRHHYKKRLLTKLAVRGDIRQGSCKESNFFWRLSAGPAVRGDFFRLMLCFESLLTNICRLKIFPSTKSKKIKKFTVISRTTTWRMKKVLEVTEGKVQDWKNTLL